MAMPVGETTLDEHALAALLSSGSGWRSDGQAITKTFTFKGFKSAMAFVNGVAELARTANHHPDIHIEAYRTVRIVLTTHAAGRVTDADISLANAIDGVEARPPGTRSAAQG